MLDDHPGIPADPYWCPERRAAKRQSARLAATLLGRLPEADSEVIRLRTIDELTTAETADALNISQSAVKVRLHRAMKRLRSQALT